MSAQIKYLGHSTFLVQSPDGKHILFEPWVHHNPACQDKTLPNLDLILISHGHSDHMWDAAKIASETGQPPTLCIVEIADYLEDSLPSVVGMNKGGTYLHGALKATFVNAHHSSSLVEETPTGYVNRVGGDPGAWVLKMDGGPTIYHAGDTCAFGDMKIIMDLHKPDVAILPIGDHYTMGPEEAAYAANMMGVPKVIPCHFATFPILRGRPEEMAPHLKPEIELIALQPGESTSI